MPRLSQFSTGHSVQCVQVRNTGYLRFIYSEYNYYIAMSKGTKSEEKTAESSSNVSTSETNTAIVKLSFDNMTDEQQKAYLEKIASEKQTDKDGQLMYERLQKAGISRIPSAKLLRMTHEARTGMAEVGLTLLKTGNIIRDIGIQCVTDGWTPKEARAYINKIVLDSDGIRQVSERTVRRVFARTPQLAEAVEDKHTPQTQKEKAEAKKSDPDAGLTKIILPPAACVAIAKHADKGCILYLKGKEYNKVKAKVETEQKGSDGKMHKVVAATPSK